MKSWTPYTKFKQLCERVRNSKQKVNIKKLCEENEVTK